jgi:hypothetical protein
VLPNVPVATNSRPVAASAVTNARPEGTGSADSVQLAPASGELAANGTCCPVVVSAVPTAATARPSLATCCSTALVAPTGRGRPTCFQFRPSGEVQAAAWSPAEPTATKPCGPAVTAIIWVAYGLPPGVPARCQPIRPPDHQAAAIMRPEMAW